MNSLRRGHDRTRTASGRKGVRRAVVLMPNGLTLFNLFCGIYAIILAMQGDVGAAPGFIVLGGIADTLDGRVARATQTGSRFGEELDSLVDAISFGFAPALIVFIATPLSVRTNLDWLLVFIFTACAVMRLARFNVEQAGRKKTHFHGLPSPAAGLTLATYYWFSQTPLYRETVILFTDGATLAQLPWHNLMRGLMAILAALMISDVPYPAMPSIGFNSIKRVLGTLMIAGAIVLLLVRREEFIFPALLAYVIYGIIKWMTIGFLGRSTTPDEIFWEREAELHRPGGERRAAFNRSAPVVDAIEELEIGPGDLDEADDDERPQTAARVAPARREGRPRDPRRERGERGERSERGPRNDRGGRSDRGDRGPKGERSEKPDKGDKTDKTEQVEKVEGSATESAEVRDAERRPDDPERQRKRRRRRGGRGTRPAGANPDGGGEAGASGDSGSFESSGNSGGDAGNEPPGPPRPEAPSPTEPAE